MTGTVTRPSSVPHRRPYTDADLPMLQRTMAGWIAATGRCGYDHIGELPHRIYENLRGRRPVGELVHVWADAAAATAAAVDPAAPYVLTDVFDCDAVRIRLLEELGFERFRVWDDVQERELDRAGPLPPVALPDGFTVRPAGRVAAFTVVWFDDHNGAGHFEPVGTDAGFRQPPPGPRPSWRTR